MSVLWDGFLCVCTSACVLVCEQVYCLCIWGGDGGEFGRYVCEGSCVCLGVLISEHFGSGFYALIAAAESSLPRVREGKRN